MATGGDHADARSSSTLKWQNPRAPYGNRIARCGTSLGRRTSRGSSEQPHLPFICPTLLRLGGRRGFGFRPCALLKRGVVIGDAVDPCADGIYLQQTIPRRAE